MVVQTVPDTFARVAELDGPVRFVFDERISEQVAGGGLSAAVVVSPATGAVRVDHGRQSLEVTVAGGFRPGHVYRVTLLPVVRDLFNNQLADPFELVFSTGPDPTPTTIAGLVWDRVTGRGVGGVEVRAIPTDDDGAVHVARADTGGVYAFRYLPEGRFRVVAFEDRNRNAEIDRMELQGERPGLIGAGDTLYLDVAVLQPDTTQAVLTRATVLDSLTLVLEFDDYLDPGSDPTRVGVTLSREDGGAPALARVYHEAEYRTYFVSVQDSFARLDSLEALAAAQSARAAPDTGGAPDSAEVGDPAGIDTPRADSAVGVDTAAADPSAVAGAAARPDSAAAGPPDTVVVGATPAGAPPRRRLPARLDPSAGAGGAPLPAERRPDLSAPPGRRLVVILDAPLAANVGYALAASGVQNLVGLPLGGGEATIVYEPPAPARPDTAAAGERAAPADTGSAAADTGRARDTLRIGALLPRRR